MAAPGLLSRYTLLPATKQKTTRDVAGRREYKKFRATCVLLSYICCLLLPSRLWLIELMGREKKTDVKNTPPLRATIGPGPLIPVVVPLVGLWFPYLIDVFSLILQRLSIKKRMRQKTSDKGNRQRPTGTTNQGFATLISGSGTCRTSFLVSCLSRWVVFTFCVFHLIHMSLSFV